MDIISDIKTLLGERAANYEDAYLALVLDATQNEVEAYCNRAINNDKQLIYAVERLVIIKLNRQNTEGLASQSSAGIGENYIDGYPADIKQLLNQKRRIHVI